jgi:hypothetical protein
MWRFYSSRFGSLLVKREAVVVFILSVNITLFFQEGIASVWIRAFQYH